MNRILAILVIALIFVPVASASLARDLSLRELRIQEKYNTQQEYTSNVLCKVTSVRRIYLCEYKGTSYGKRMCSIMYVHYNERTHSIAHSTARWRCSDIKRIPSAKTLTPYPGDQLPAA